ncbi:DUF6193 family natural product biosynthesis protein [Streptomyces sp. NPDC056333]|uniref:DUF6193 family natural product biosynthesis protein n=1 Tax=Streptomyces sp. NPDC056333 TaxID=3345786 RepID=UPI0035E1EBD5
MRTPSGAARQRSRPTSAFLAHTGQPSDVKVAIAPAHGGLPYRVRKFLHADESTGEAATAEQTVALAVTQFPADLGPATAGTADPDG